MAFLLPYEPIESNHPKCYTATDWTNTVKSHTKQWKFSEKTVSKAKMIIFSKKIKKLISCLFIQHSWRVFKIITIVIMWQESKKNIKIWKYAKEFQWSLVEFQWNLRRAFITTVGFEIASSKQRKQPMRHLFLWYYVKKLQKTKTGRTQNLLNKLMRKQRWSP